MCRKFQLPSSPSLSTQTRELFSSLSLIVLVVLFGTGGYMLIAGWNWFDSLYMTIITLATIGYGEVHPLDVPGRAFTIVLVLSGVGVASFVFSALTTSLIRRRVFSGEKRMQEKIDKYQGHTVFCGFGRLGRVALSELRDTDVSIVVVDRNPDRLAEAAAMGFLTVEGDATAEETLTVAGVVRAKRLVTLLPKDADNLYVILTARELNPDLAIISRAEDVQGEKRLKRAGATKIIAPHREGGWKIAHGILRPSVADFIDVAVSGKSVGLQLEQIRIPDDSPFSDVSIQAAGLRQKADVIIAAIVTKAGDMNFNPAADTKLEAGATLIGLGLRKDIAELERMLTRVG